MRIKLLSILIIGMLLCNCFCKIPSFKAAEKANKLSPAIETLVNSAIEQTKFTRYYDASYVEIDYPNGDVPIERGVCADVIVRALRKDGIDLQKEIHEDMLNNFSEYPNLWGHKRPDANIDHRRVPNLMKYFERNNRSIAITQDPNDYLPGDIVAWRFSNGLLHMGVVINQVSCSGKNFSVVHNAGAGARAEDKLFYWQIIGHYRYFD